MARFSARLLGPGHVLAAGNRHLAIGRFPRGVDALAEDLVARVRRSGIASDPEPDVMAAKWSKLVMNCVNAVYAICDVPVAAARTNPTVAGLINVVWDEAERVLTAAGVAHEPVPPLAIPSAVATAGPSGAALPAAGGETPYYGSTWDDLARRHGKSELPWLNGEIVRLAEQVGMPAPANALLLRIGLDMAERREPPGRHAPAELLALVSEAAQPAPRGAPDARVTQR
jgi:2-dehydropantoate 2-reductase